MSEKAAGQSDAYNAKRRERWAQDPVYRAKGHARSRAHYQANKQERRRRARSYRQANKEKESARARAYYRAHKQEINKRCRAYYYAHKHESAVQSARRLYGISPAEYDALLAKQGGACAICRKRSKGRLCVDHCHLTGTIRGLLCHTCNRALGALKDDQASLVAALAYLGALPRDEPGSAAQRALAVHNVLPSWPWRRAVLTHPPIRCDATPPPRPNRVGPPARRASGTSCRLGPPGMLGGGLTENVSGRSAMRPGVSISICMCVDRAGLTSTCRRRRSHAR
jgi:Recombination endonuclease VII